MSKVQLGKHGFLYKSAPPMRMKQTPSPYKGHSPRLMSLPDGTKINPVSISTARAIQHPIPYTHNGEPCHATLRLEMGKHKCHDIPCLDMIEAVHLQDVWKVWANNRGKTIEITVEREGR